MATYTETKGAPIPLPEELRQAFKKVGLSQIDTVIVFDKSSPESDITFVRDGIDLTGPKQFNPNSLERPQVTMSRHREKTSAICWCLKCGRYGCWWVPCPC